MWEVCTTRGYGTCVRISHHTARQHVSTSAHQHISTPSRQRSMFWESSTACASIVKCCQVCVVQSAADIAIHRQSLWHFQKRLTAFRDCLFNLCHDLSTKWDPPTISLHHQPHAHTPNVRSQLYFAYETHSSGVLTPPPARAPRAHTHTLTHTLSHTLSLSLSLSKPRTIKNSSTQGWWHTAERCRLNVAGCQPDHAGCVKPSGLQNQSYTTRGLVLLY